MNSTGSLETELGGMRQGALTAGAAGLAACLVAVLAGRPLPVLHSYLFAFVFWAGAGLGCMAILMLHHMVGGTWGFALRRLLESGARTLILMAAFVAPILLAMPKLYSWAGTDRHNLPPFKQVYLSIPFFVTRTVIYFAAWVLLAWFLLKWSNEQDRTGESGLTRRLQNLSGPGLVIYGLTVTYASVDWVMSLEPTWFSTIYGMIIMVTQALAAMAIVTVAAALLRCEKPLAKILSPLVFNDFGNLLLTFTMLWAYLSFSQYLIIWSGNMPDETQWYVSRASGGWAWVAVVLIVFHFAVPFVLLLMRFIKRRAQVLAGVAAGLIVMSAVDIYWLTVPAFASDRRGPSLHWTDAAAWIGIGGVWLWSFITHLKGRSLVPLHDPRLEGIVLNE